MTVTRLDATKTAALAACAALTATENATVSAAHAARAAAISLAVSAQSGLDTAFQKFWDAKSPADAVKQVEAIVKSGVTFDEAFRRLKQGRTYGPQKTGNGNVVMMTNNANGIEHYYAVNVPANYDPAKKYQVWFQLHGGVMGRTTNQPLNSRDL